MKEAIDRTMIRNLVKEVISEVVKDQIKKVKAGDLKGKAGNGDNVTVETIAIANDDDLSRFVHYLLKLSKNSEDWLALEEGQRVFRLKETVSAMQATLSPSTTGGKTEKIDRGLINENRIAALAKKGIGHIVLGKPVVVTPLGRDKARDLNIILERKKR